MLAHTPWLWAASGALLAALATTALVLLRGHRRRAAIGEAIHELRRPLQALALAGPGQREAGESSVKLAAAALARLEGVIAGGEPDVVRRESVRCDQLARAAVRRWQVGAAVEGGELALSWRAGAAVVEGDAVELGQALDNLIVNAIEHGGPRIVVEGAGSRDSVRLCVADFGARSAPRLRGDAFSVAVDRFAARRERGHGLAVVRRTAARHGGRFVLEHTGAGSRAVLELPRRAGLPALLAG